MNKYYYDLHIHSCLSPCADDDMTPANIAGMASIQGLTLLALTDHNSCDNCPAFFAHCKRYGIVPVAGMELTTAEDIHLLCLFPTLDSAMSFGDEVKNHLIKVANRPEIFGNQFVMDENDEVKSEYEYLLINATDLDIESASKLVDSFGGVSYPAHIDRESNGIVSVLGTFPESPEFSAFELNDKSSLDEYRKNYGILNSKRYVVSSDAHHLWCISEAENEVALDDEPYSSQRVREALIAYLKGSALN